MTWFRRKENHFLYLLLNTFRKACKHVIGITCGFFNMSIIHTKPPDNTKWYYFGHFVDHAECKTEPENIKRSLHNSKS